ncbi:hypothetical protein ABC195_11575 [Microbacterium sp. 2P01SA-2]|uniref:hypothetical protein n=1 Tax=unclassified Microbacterium TaxID=2609290 RepID=UPI00399F934E
MTTKQRAREAARQVLLHPLLWGALCIVVAVPLLGTAHDFWGFLLCLFAGWSAAHALVRWLHTMPRTLSVALHLAASVGVGVLLFATLADDGWRGMLPPAIAAALGFTAVPAAGWIWLTLVGRVSGAVAAASRRRAAALVVPQWERVGDVWNLRLPVVALRSPVYIATVATIAVLGAGLVVTVTVVFDDILVRVGPLLMLLVLGWGVAAPAYLVLRAIAHHRTADVVITVDGSRDSQTVRVARSPEAEVLFEAPVGGIRSLQLSARTSPVRIVIRPFHGSGLVLLVGLARRRPDAAPTFALPPAHLIDRLGSAGLVRRPPHRSGNGDVVLESTGGAAPG